MKLVIKDDYKAMSEYTATIIADAIAENPSIVLGLPTGSTPIGTYEKLSAMYKEGKVNFAGVTTFNLDEYYRIQPENDQSYHYFMHKNLFNNVNVKPENVHIPFGNGDDPDADGVKYDKMIEEAGGIDIQLLGSGVNGHIGFNEPEDELTLGTHLTSLTENTIEVNSRFFESADDVPRHAVTMGIASIFKARKILILLNGKNKAEALKAMFSGKISCKMPVSLLQLHGDVTVVTDKETAEAAGIN